MTNIADYFYTWFRLTDTESLSGKYLLIALGMQLGESHTKLKLIAVDVYRAIGFLFSLHSILWQAVGIDTEEIPHPCLLQFKESSHTVCSMS